MKDIYIYIEREREREREREKERDTERGSFILLKNKLPCFLCFFALRHVLLLIFLKFLGPNGPFTLQVISYVRDSVVRDFDVSKRFVCTSQA